MMKGPRLPLAAAAFLAPVFFWPGGRDSFEIPKLIVVALCVFAAACVSPVRAPKAATVAVGLSLLALCLSTAFSVSPLRSLFGSSVRADGALAAVVFLSLFLLARECEDDLPERALLWGTVLAAAYGLVQAAGFDPLPWAVGAEYGNSALATRAFGTLANPSFLGLQCAVVLPIAVRRLPDQWAWGAVLVLAAGIAVSQSRAAALGALLAVPIAFPGGWRRSWSVVGCLFLVFALTGLRERAAQTRFDAGSTAVRASLWRVGLQAVAERPELGYGPGCVGLAIDENAPPEMPPDQRLNPSMHNLLLDVAASTGILGLGALFAWLAALGRPLRARPEILAAAVAFGICVSVGFAGVAGWATMALLAGIAFRTDEDRPLPRWLLPLALLPAVAGALWLFTLR